MDKTRDQYYLHQFDVNQPDLNLRSKLVLDQLKVSIIGIIFFLLRLGGPGWI